jgi:non-specific serine/threonine protein kinase
VGHLAWVQSDFVVAEAHLRQSLAIRRDVGGPLELAYALGFLAAVVRGKGDNEAAAPLAAESLGLFQSGSDRWGLAFAQINAGNVARERGDVDTAVGLYEEAMAILGGIGETWLLSLPLRYLARLALERGDFARAAALQRESLIRLQEPEERWFLSQAFDDLAVIAAAEGHHRRAARLLGASEALREAIGAPVHPSLRGIYERTVAAAREGLGAAVFAAGWAEGRALSLAAAIVEALAEDATGSAPIAAPETALPATPLTRREREVLRLLAAGHTDRESGAILFISPRTVETHVTNILNKLGLPSRLAAVVYAARNGLA